MLTSQVCGGSLMVAAKPSTSGLRLRGRPVRVDELMMGCAFINSKGEPGATVSAAWKAGITSFDTAAAYGESEARLGEALAAAGITDEATVITKVRGDPGSEPRFTQMDQTAAAAAHTLAVSKSTMGLKRIHTLRFHDADDARITEAVKPGGLVAGLRALRDAGEIDGISLGMCVREEDPASCELVLRLIRESPPDTFDSAMLAYGWNLQNQSSLPILLEAEKRGIEIHPAGEFEPLLASCGWSLVTLPYRGPCHRGVFLQRLREFVRPVQNRGRRSPGEAHKVGRPC
jgi:aryl-alcohol dehydrogenase-like predicted oxidoreductase